MSRKTVVISINASWNIFNFRKGLIAALLQRGYRVVALAPPDPFSARLVELGAEFVPIEMDNQGASPVEDLRLLRRYYRALGEIRPDVFLGYTIKPNVYGSLAAQSRGIKVINNVSGLGTAFLSGGLLNAIVVRLYRAAFRRSEVVFFQNADDRSLFLARRLVRRDQARLLPGSGIDLVHFAPQPPAGSGNGISFLFVGRLLWDKGLREYVDAARIVRRELPDVRFRILGFLDVANRTAASRADVEAWVAEGLIDYIGSADDVRPAMTSANCIVLPSYREGLPRALLEGSALARPLIATDVPGCRDVVEHGVNGYLCTVKDAGSLADAMMKMARLQPRERAAMGAAARAKVEREYDEKLVFARYLEAISDAVGSTD